MDLELAREMLADALEEGDWKQVGLLLRAIACHDPSEALRLLDLLDDGLAYLAAA